MLYLWTKGPLNVRLSGVVVKNISYQLIELQKYISSDFARKPRAFSELFLKNMYMIDYANYLLLHFVTQFGRLYGDEYISYNIHNLIHLAEDCRRYGHLDLFSTFPFKNSFQKKSTNPLAQLRNREEERCNTLLINTKSYPIIKKKKCE
ncbi:Uncharacterized protein FWK35_00033047 [Aphis craccivora]|uniref:Uncharacterized protein n=1 Tax=Aphis craccivora TaxID=307492 RepID=A0A6G0VLA0_APHCR|nr:Uncharacterized protein FWK35_00033047 [Aphis craccivora]